MQLVWGAGIEAPSGIATTLDQKLPFQVRPAFTAHVQCGRVNARAGCIPLQPIRLQFSAPVPVAMPTRRASSLLTAARWRRNRSRVAWQPSKNSSSSRRLPTTRSFTCSLPSDVVDDIGRPLANADRFPLEVKIDEYPPLAKFAGTFGILEANEGAVLPVTLRNVEATVARQSAPTLPGKRLRETSDAASQSQSGCNASKRRTRRAAPGRYDEAQQAIRLDRTNRRSVGVRRIRFNRIVHDSHRVLAATPRRARSKSLAFRSRSAASTSSNSRAADSARRCSATDAPRYVSTAVLVTNLSVHFKWGRESSRVWVTHLDDATPVADADVEITDYCSGTSRWHGRTDRDGIAIDRCNRSANRTAATRAATRHAADDQRAHRRRLQFRAVVVERGHPTVRLRVAHRRFVETRDLSQRARSAAVPRRRNGFDEAFPAPPHRSPVSNWPNRCPAQRTVAHHAPRQRQLVRNGLSSSTRTALPKRRGRFRRKRSSATTRSKSATPTRPGTTAATSKSSSSGCRPFAQRSTDLQMRSCVPRKCAGPARRVSVRRWCIAVAGEAAHDDRAANAHLPGLRRLPVRRRIGGGRHHANRRRMRTTSNPTRPPTK